MKLSVVVTNYNHERYLRQRIDSILAQTYSDFELLLLDDVSADASRDVLASYAGDPRVSLHFATVNSGSVYAQWQRALELSSGDYIWIAQSDDFAEPTFLERTIAALDSDPAIGIAVVDTRVVDGAGKFLHDHASNWSGAKGAAPRKTPFMVIDGPAYCRAHMHPWNSIPNVSATLIRRSMFAAIGGPVLDMPLCGDWMTYSRMLMKGSIARIPEVLSSFRWHDQSVGSLARASAFVRQSMTVQGYLQQQLGLDPRLFRKEIRRFFAQALMAGERRLPSGKVPFRRTAAVLRDAFDLGPAMAMIVGAILLREGAAGLVPWRRPSA